MKKIYCILSVFILLLGLCSCGIFSGNKYRKVIHNYLKDTYDIDFEILQLTKEFSGYEGVFVRAVCRAEGYQEKCVVYAYRDFETEGTEYKIGFKTYTLVDDFQNILLADRYEKEIQEKLGGDVFVKSSVSTSHGRLTREEYESDVQECISNSRMNYWVSTYILADVNKYDEGFSEEVEQLLLGYKAHVQFVSIGYSDKMDKVKWEKAYYENCDNFSDYFFDDENKNDLTLWVEGCAMTRDDGIYQRITKGGEKTWVK